MVETNLNAHASAPDLTPSPRAVDRLGRYEGKSICASKAVQAIDWNSRPRNVK